MEVTVDGYIYEQQEHGGISRMFTELLPRMCELDPTLRITLLTSGRCRRRIPAHLRIRHRCLPPLEKLLRPRQFMLPLRQTVRETVQWAAMEKARGAIWHSTYFTTPRRWNGPLVITVYDMIYERYASLFTSANDERFRQQKRSSVLAADMIVCISQTTLRDVQSYYGIDGAKLQAIPLAYGPYFQPLGSGDCPAEWPNNRPFLLYVGRRSHYKNFKTLLQAYSIWRRRNEVDLLVVGPQWTGEERESLLQHGCADRVHLLHGVDDRLLACLYGNACALVYPSLYEGFGIPLLEAMACGCPVVASRISSTVEVAGRIPFYFEPTSVDELLDALDAALSEGRRPERVASSLRSAQRYSWNKSAAQTLQVYRSLTGA